MVICYGTSRTFIPLLLSDMLKSINIPTDKGYETIPDDPKMQQFNNHRKKIGLTLLFIKELHIKHQRGSSLIKVAKSQHNVNGQYRSGCGKTNTLKHHQRTCRIGPGLLRNSSSIPTQYYFYNHLWVSDQPQQSKSSGSHGNTRQAEPSLRMRHFKCSCLVTHLSSPPEPKDSAL